MAGAYRTIVVDPPWPYGAWGKGSPRARPWKARAAHRITPLAYATLEPAALMRLPIADLAAPDCDLYLWTTQRYLPVAFGVLGAWGFRYCQTITWCKAPMGRGQGGLFCPTTEFVLLGRRGRMPRARRVDSTWFQWKRTRSHSTKPEAFYDMIEAVSEGPRMELFARRCRLGWDVLGDAIDGRGIEDALRATVCA